MMKFACLLVLFTVFASLSFVSCARPKWHQLDTYTFERYVKDFGKDYPFHEIDLRREIFERKLEGIRKHNANPYFTWKEGVNQFTDHSEEEFSRVLGYNKKLGYSQVSKRSKIPSEEFANIDFTTLPLSVDWRDKNILTPVKDQGRCGSCWTFAAAETLESHYALASGTLLELSEQMILDCTPNPNNCGGAGGCEGGTVELAYSTILINGWKGLMSEWYYPYLSHSGINQNKCLFNISYVESQLDGYEVLPSNQYAPLIAAVATKGPIAISVEAETWSNYESGVFNGCNKTNPDIDHAVQLVGYGTDAKLGDYWLVRNSWTPFWGEQGYIRLARSSNVTCGIDITPGDGDACDGGPPSQVVCGTCGILFDTSFPIVYNFTLSY